MSKFTKIIFFLPFILLIGTSYWYYEQLQAIKNANFIIINKADMTLYQYNYKGELKHQFKVATGENFGNKIKKGDHKTPEGIFTITEVLDASAWSHDFKDGLAIINGAYGPYFIRLNVPGQKGIGIHGTHNNASLGKRASEGCIRLNNDDLKELVQNIETNSVVVITPSIDDVKFNANPDMPNNSDIKNKIEKQIKERPTKAGNSITIK